MSRYIPLALAAAALALPAAAAERKFDPDACAKAVAPFLDERTVAVLHVDLTAVDVGAVADKLADLAKVNADALPFARKEMAASVKELTGAGARDLYVVVSLADIPEHSPFVVIPLPKSADVKDPSAAVAPWHLLADSFNTPNGSALVLADHAATFKRLHDLDPFAPPDLAKAFGAAGGDLAQLAVVPPRDAGKVLDQVMPTLPAEVGGGSSRVLTQGFRWAALGVDARTLKLSLTVQAADSDAAKALLDLFQKTTAAVGKSKEVRKALPSYDKLTELLTPKVVKDRLELSLEPEALRPLLTEALQGAARAESESRLRQLAVAALDYESAHRTYPPAATYDNRGAPLLSWRVHLLPYLGQEKLYKEFHLDEPWDSDHNKPLIARMPAVFRSTADPKLADEGKTTLLAPVGDATMFPAGRGVRIAEVTDGTSATILFVQADDDYAAVWTKPDDLSYDAKDPWKGLADRFPDGFLAAFADGEVRFVPRSIGKDMLRALFTRSGGEAVTPP